MLKCLGILLVASRVDTWHIWHHKHFNLELKLATTSWGKTIDLEVLRGLINIKELIDIKMAVIKSMQNLNLTMDETVIMGCLTMLASGRCYNVLMGRICTYIINYICLCVPSMILYALRPCSCRLV